MTVAGWVQFGALLIALVTLVVQQTREFNIRRRSERRTENKLKVYYMCQTDTGLAEEEICKQYTRNHPAEKIDSIEIRKTIYEMLVDGTLYYLKDKTSGLDKYKALRKVRKQEAEQGHPADRRVAPGSR